MARKKKLTLEEYRKANNLVKVEVKDESALPDTIEELKPDTSIQSSLFTRKSIVEFKTPVVTNYAENTQEIDSSGFARKSKTVFQTEDQPIKYFDDMQDKPNNPEDKISFERKAKDEMKEIEPREDNIISFNRKPKDDLDVNKLKSSSFTRRSILEIKKEKQPEAIEIGEGRNGMEIFKNL